MAISGKKMTFSERIEAVRNWEAPASWDKFSTIDVHTEGEPLRLIYAGYPKILGKTILEKRTFTQANYDDLRKALMWEPRGHADMYGCIITEPVTSEADFGVLFLHNEGFSTMCGHGIIGVTSALFELGIFEPTTKKSIKIDTPAGLVEATVNVQEGRVISASFINVPSFVVELGSQITVPTIGVITYDLAFGGAFYAYVDVKEVRLNCHSSNYKELIDVGMSIKKAIQEKCEIQHPIDRDLGFLYGVIFIEQVENHDVHSKNVCMFADGEIDRSPTGTGVSGRLAIHFAKGEINLNQSIKIASIIDSSFTCRVIGTTTVADFPAIVPEVTGRAYITGKHTFYLNPDDPYRHGFFLR